MTKESELESEIVALKEELHSWRTGRVLQSVQEDAYSDGCRQGFRDGIRAIVTAWTQLEYNAPYLESVQAAFSKDTRRTIFEEVLTQAIQERDKLIESFIPKEEDD